MLDRSSFYSLKNWIIAIGFPALYLLVSFILIGFKSDQLILCFLFAFSYMAHPISRQVICGFSIFIIYWVIFDYMKAFPNYRFGKVHIQQIYEAEKYLFGVHSNNQLLTPNEYFKTMGNTIGYLFAGVFYLSWVPIPLLFASYLFVKKPTGFLLYSLGFLLVNLIGFVIYYIYPAAPPWYVQEHGFGFVAHTVGSPAGLLHFDEITGTTIFQSLYKKGSNVFAAMPSLHSAYPLFTLWFCIKLRLKWLIPFAVFIMLGIWWAAVYTSHHYVLDVLAGICCSTLGILLMEMWLLKTSWFQRFIAAYLMVITKYIR